MIALKVYSSLSEQTLEVLEGHNVNIFAYGAIAGVLEIALRMHITPL